MSDDINEPPEGDYKVGYCKPPREHRFKAGHKLSKGRPRGARNTKLLIIEEWHRAHPAIVNGKKRRVSRSELGARRLASKASEGDLKAIEILMRTEAELAEKAAARQAVSSFAELGDKLAMAAITRRIRNLREDGSECLVPKTNEAEETAPSLRGDEAESRPDMPATRPLSNEESEALLSTEE